MIPKPSSQTISLSDGREITIETGKLAKQAHGSVVIKMGDCMLLSTVVSSYSARRYIISCLHVINCNAVIQGTVSYHDILYNLF